jgi:hypothetical protein
VLRTPLGPYLRYECEWGYAYNVQVGKDIRILDLAETPEPPGLVDHDFWLVDSGKAAVSRATPALLPPNHPTRRWPLT